MKRISIYIVAIFLLLPISSITAQTSKGTNLSDLSPKEKMQILANQIQLRDNRIGEIEKEIARLEKRGSKKSSTTKTSDKALQQIVEQLKVAEEALMLAKSDNEKFQAIIQKLETESNQNTNQVAIQNPPPTQQISDVQNKLSLTEKENTKLKTQLKDAAEERLENKREIDNLQNELSDSAPLAMDEGGKSKKRKNRKVNEDQRIEKKPVKGKNYFYITASQNLSIDNNFGVEIGKIKNFNKRSSKAIRLGLDVAYLSANIFNFDLDEIDTSLEEPSGVVGLKIGPNLNIRLMKGIVLNASYRFFPAANVTTFDDELDVEYKGFHTAGGSLKIGPVMARLEFDLTKQDDINPNLITSEMPMTVYLGLMF